ncbi:hypothetical protein Gotur_005328 [Gossypium turneri]
MRRALLGELEGTCITRAKSKKIPHEYSTIAGNLYETRNSFICAKGPGYVTAQDIILPPSMEIVDNTQHVASLTEPIDLCIGLQIKRNRGYGIKMPKNFHNGSYPIELYSCLFEMRIIVFIVMGMITKNMRCFFLEIWINGSLTPKEAFHKAFHNLID